MNRFEPDICCGVSCVATMVRCEDGEYVRLSDAKAEIEKLKTENEQLRLSKESEADAFCRVLDALSRASPDTITHHLDGEGACMAMVNDLRWMIDQGKAENERLKASHARYETLRKLNAVQFQHLYTKALQSPIPFDELVDMLGETK